MYIQIANFDISIALTLLIFLTFKVFRCENRTREKNGKTEQVWILSFWVAHVFVYKFERSVLFQLKSAIQEIFYTILLKYFCDSRQNKQSIELVKVIYAASSSIFSFFRRFGFPQFFDSSVLPFFSQVRSESRLLHAPL